MKMSQKGSPEVSVIVCAHNEEKYVRKCLSSVLNAVSKIESEIVFVADRCADNTVEIARKFGLTNIVEKKWKKWKNSYAEALQTGFLRATGKHVSIIDADIVVPNDFFGKLIPMVGNNVVSVSARVVTYPLTFLNRLVYAWERTWEFAPLGKSPRGAARVVLKQALDEVGGFNDVLAPDTELDLRLIRKGYKSVYARAVRVWHIRDITFNKTIKGQINTGRARYTLSIGIIRTIGHAVFRFRPFIVCGWLLEWVNKSKG